MAIKVVRHIENIKRGFIVISIFDNDVRIVTRKRIALKFTETGEVNWEFFKTQVKTLVHMSREKTVLDIQTGGIIE